MLFLKLEIQLFMTIYLYINIYIYIIISDLVYDRDQKPRYILPYLYIEFLFNLSRYQPALGNERSTTKTNKYKEYKYFVILFCTFVLCLIKNLYN